MKYRKIDFLAIFLVVKPKPGLGLTNIFNHLGV